MNPLIIKIALKGTAKCPICTDPLEENLFGCFMDVICCSDCLRKSDGESLSIASYQSRDAVYAPLFTQQFGLAVFDCNLGVDYDLVRSFRSKLEICHESPDLLDPNR